MNQIHSFPDRKHGRDTRLTLGEVALASQELQARTRGDLALRVFRALARAGLRIFRARSPREPGP